MRRRSFLVRAGSLLFAQAALGLACGGGEEGGDADAGSGSFAVTNQDDSGHSHELVLLCSDLAAGRAVTYVATGEHEHTVMLSESQVGMVAAGESVEISFTDGHSHTFLIAAPASAC